VVSIQLSTPSQVPGREHSEHENLHSHLAAKDIWTGPSVLLSPIPNTCNHIQGDSWEEEWISTLNLLILKNVGPIAIGVGTSSDEQSLIVDMIEEAQVCGSIYGNEFRKKFERCLSWSLFSFPGDHGWRTETSNAPNIALLIDAVIEMDGKIKKQNVADLQISARSDLL